MKIKLVVLLSLFAVILGCDPAPVDVESDSSPATEELEPASVDVAPISTPVDVTQDRQVTVTNSELVEVLDTNNEFVENVEPKGGQLVVVYLTLKNTGSESGNMMFSTFELVDNQDRVYKDLSLDPDSAGPLAVWEEAQGLDMAISDIFPGGEVKVAKAFRVAPDAAGLQLKVNNKVMAIE